MSGLSRNDLGSHSRRRSPWWRVLAVPAVLFWVLIAYLLSIEVWDLLRGANTEHSPLLVVAILLPLAGLLTWAALTARRW